MGEAVTGAEMAALDEAIEVLGGVTALAAAITCPQRPVSQSAVSNWKTRGRVPSDYCPAIERETRLKGRAVLCERLSRHVDWGELRRNPLQRSYERDAAAPPVQQAGQRALDLVAQG
jgi:DNA-binding transcriptional regulator YdaS (Cro superfamily)